MKFDPHRAIVNRETGKPLQEQVGDDVITLTHGILVVRALDARRTDERDLPAEEGMRRFLLGSRILLTPPDELVDLLDGEPSLIKKLVAKTFAPGFYGQIHVAIDAAASEQ